ncbi:MAG: iron chaperone [Nitrososphaerales archaeon]
MQTKQAQPTTVDEYILQFPEDVQEILRKIRTLIKQSAPEAEERIGYRMPAYYLNGPLVYFAAFKRHIGFYPAGHDLAPLADEVTPYRQAKGTLQFPLNQPIPYDLIGRIVQHRVAENLKDRKSRSRKA